MNLTEDQAATLAVCTVCQVGLEVEPVRVALEEGRQRPGTLMCDDCNTDTARAAKAVMELGTLKAAASRRVRGALERGYLKNLEDRKGRPARLILGEPMPEDAAILPDPEELNVEAEGGTVDALTVYSGGIPHPPPPQEETEGGGCGIPSENGSTGQRLTEKQAQEVQKLMASGMEAGAARREVLGD